MNKSMTRQKLNCIVEYLCSHSLRSTIWYCSRSPPPIIATISGSVASSLTTSQCREDVAKSYMLVIYCVCQVWGIWVGLSNVFCALGIKIFSR